MLTAPDPVPVVPVVLDPLVVPAAVPPVVPEPVGLAAVVVDAARTERGASCEQLLTTSPELGLATL